MERVLLTVLCCWAEFRLYVCMWQKNPVLETVHQESVKVYLHLGSGNAQQAPSMRSILCH